MIDINVTEECINIGKKRHERYCPIGLAFRHAGITNVYIWGSGNIKIGGMSVLKIPRRISEFIQNFDDDFQVFPFSFKYNPETNEILCEASLHTYNQFPERG